MPPSAATSVATPPTPTIATVGTHHTMPPPPLPLPRSSSTSTSAAAAASTTTAHGTTAVAPPTVEPTFVTPLSPSSEALEAARTIVKTDRKNRAELTLQTGFSDMFRSLRVAGDRLQGAVYVESSDIQTFTNCGTTVKDCATYNMIRDWAGGDAAPAGFGFFKPDMLVYAEVEGTTLVAASGEIKVRPKDEAQRKAKWVAGMTQAVIYALQLAEAFAARKGFFQMGPDFARLFVEDIDSRQVCLEVSPAHLAQLELPSGVIGLTELIERYPGHNDMPHHLERKDGNAVEDDNVGIVIDERSLALFWSTFAQPFKTLLHLVHNPPLPALFPNTGKTLLDEHSSPLPAMVPHTGRDEAMVIVVNANGNELLVPASRQRSCLGDAADAAELGRLTAPASPASTDDGSVFEASLGMLAAMPQVRRHLPRRARDATDTVAAVVSTASADDGSAVQQSKCTASSLPKACRPELRRRRNSTSSSASDGAPPTNRRRVDGPVAAIASAATARGALPRTRGEGTESGARALAVWASNIDDDTDAEDEDMIPTLEDVVSLARAIGVQVRAVLPATMDRLYEEASVGDAPPAPPTPPPAHAASSVSPPIMPPPPMPSSPLAASTGASTPSGESSASSSGSADPSTIGLAHGGWATPVGLRAAFATPERQLPRAIPGSLPSTPTHRRSVSATLMWPKPVPVPYSPA